MQHVVVSFESGVSKEDNQFGVAMSIPGCDSFLAGGASLRETVNHRYENIMNVLGSGISGWGGDAGCIADDRADFYIASSLSNGGQFLERASILQASCSRESYVFLRQTACEKSNV